MSNVKSLIDLTAGPIERVGKVDFSTDFMTVIFSSFTPFSSDYIFSHFLFVGICFYQQSETDAGPHDSPIHRHLHTQQALQSHGKKS